jgi:hypothetical protein
VTGELADAHVRHRHRRRTDVFALNIVRPLVIPASSDCSTEKSDRTSSTSVESDTTAWFCAEA